MKVDAKVMGNLSFARKPVVASENSKNPDEADDIFAAQEKQPGMVTEATVIKAIEKANKITIDHRTRAEFSVHEVTKDVMVKIIDTETNEVIREFPPKKILDLIAKLWDLAGIVVDERR